VASKVKSAIGSAERILLPRLNSIDGELKSINTRIDSGEKGQQSLKNELLAVLRAGFAEQNARIDRVTVMVEQQAKEFNTQRELAILKAKVADLERKS
jgi:hypothetical protein